MQNYNHKEIENKWRSKWAENHIYQVDLDKAKKPFYNLMMFPYPSAEGLHVGNMYAFVHSDAYGRFMRLKGYDVFEPIGLDGFGIHSENYAIKIKEHIRDVSVRTEKHFYDQLHMIGNAYDWSRTVETYKPNYYKWTQWLFLKMYEKGLVTRKESSVNWCPGCKTVLSDEQVIDGKCERCDSQTEKKKMNQWFWQITKYAERLLKNLDNMDWSEDVKTIQRNWIGKSEGARINFTLKHADGTQTNAELPLKIADETQTNAEFLYEDITYKIRGAIFSVKKELGLGHKEIVYHRALVKEFEKIGLKFESEKNIPIHYDNEKIGSYQPDLVVEEKVIVELKALPSISKPQQNQIWSYLKGSNYKLALLVNFGGTDVDIKRIVYDTARSQRSSALSQQSSAPSIEVFTTRPDTLFGCTYMVVCPEHKVISDFRLQISNFGEVEGYIAKSKKKSDLERTDLNKDKTGVKLEGISAINPVNNEEIPIFVADYVLADYGTGAIMAVPAHDQRDWEFAKKYDLKIIPVIMSKEQKIIEISGKVEVVKNKNHPRYDFIKTVLFESICKQGAMVTDGINIDSDFLDGLETKEAKEKMINWLEENNFGQREINFRLRDWCISRQRYWGPPIPVIFCEKCSWVLVLEKDLPVLLPEMDNFLPDGTGKGPLNKIADFVNTTCPKCGGPAKRETDVSDPFVDSCWYYMRYLCTDFLDKALDKERLKKWMPINMYIGGKEHAVLHLLYSRFVTMVMQELGLAPTEEPFKQFRAHGLLIRDGAKISKSKGNIINPDEYIEKFGADAVRLYLMFLGDMRQGGDWRDNGMAGMSRFVNRCYNITEKITDKENKEVTKLLHKTIKSIGDDLTNLKYNTAIAKFMTMLNEIEAKGCVKSDCEKFAIMLAPFAPFLAEELWSSFAKATEDKFPSDKNSGNSAKYCQSVFKQNWPEYDPALARDEVITLAIQINGKLRDTIEVAADISEEDVKKIALESEKVKKWIEEKEIKKIVYVKGKLLSIVV